MAYVESREKNQVLITSFTLQVVPKAVERLRSLSTIWTDKMKGIENQVIPPFASGSHI